MTEQPQTPRRVAENEAAKQAVGFAFALLTLAVMVWAQRKIMPQHPLDFAGAAQRRMDAARQAAERWDRVAAYCFRTDMIRLATLAHKRAESAREAYERERYV